MTETLNHVEITPQLLYKAICTLRDRWVQRGNVKEVYQINRAWCWSFAEDLFDLLAIEERVSKDKLLGDRGNFGDQDVLFYLSNECFQMIHDANGKEIPIFREDGVDYFAWNIDLLERWNLKPPQGMSWEEANRVPFGYHVFLVFNNRFYDAECPEGVNSFFDLPLYKETIQEYLNENQKKTEGMI
ncbi:hypothetical protein ACFVS2_25610 [Brevibacillus sp. NPDC058079]|uniref:hypothetical protein n=1 Tax=Brevibacillus sp. NPDC058079 TaxID=3346330 RepID=UPI0036F0C329